MRIYYTTQGGHVHCRVFTTGKCGDLVFGVEEWPKLRASFLEAGFSTIEETALLLGLDAAQLAEIVEPVRPSAAMARRWLAGRSDMGTVRLVQLIDWAASTGRPEGAEEIVRELAGRQRARRER